MSSKPNPPTKQTGRNYKGGIGKIGKGAYNLGSKAVGYTANKIWNVTKKANDEITERPYQLLGKTPFLGKYTTKIGNALGTTTKKVGKNVAGYGLPLTAILATLTLTTDLEKYPLNLVGLGDKEATETTNGMPDMSDKMESEKVDPAQVGQIKTPLGEQVLEKYLEFKDDYDENVTQQNLKNVYTFINHAEENGYLKFVEENSDAGIGDMVGYLLSLENANSDDYDNWAPFIENGVTGFEFSRE